MLGYKSLSSLALLGAVAGCAPRTLVLVDLVADSGLAPTPIDGHFSDTSDASDAARASDAATPATLLRGLVGLWHLDDGVGSKVALDSSGNGNHATLVGLDPTVAWVAGRQGGALATNGAGYALVEDSASIDGITAQVTVSAWVYFDGVIPVDYGTAISREIGASDLQYYHLSLFQDGTPTLFIGLSAKGVPVRATAATVIEPRRWTHLAGTYDGSRAVLFVDGVEVSSRSISGTFVQDTTPVVLGGNGNKVGITEWFPGCLDEIALYNRALSPEEIRLLAAAVEF